MPKQHITQTILEAGRLKNYFFLQLLPKFLFQGKPGDFLHFSYNNSYMFCQHRHAHKSYQCTGTYVEVQGRFMLTKLQPSQCQ